MDVEKCADKWEEIVVANARANNTFEYDNYLDKHKTYALLIHEYVTVKAMLTKLTFSVDMDAINWLNKRGYKIVISKGPDRNKLYEDSLMAAIRKSDNLVTKTTMKANELKQFQTHHGQIESFEQIMANIIFHSKMNLPDDITLARYNAIKKLINQQNKK